MVHEPERRTPFAVVADQLTTITPDDYRHGLQRVRRSTLTGLVADLPLVLIERLAPRPHVVDPTEMQSRRAILERLFSQTKWVDEVMYTLPFERQFLLGLGSAVAETRILDDLEALDKKTGKHTLSDRDKLFFAMNPAFGVRFGEITLADFISNGDDIPIVDAFRYLTEAQLIHLEAEGNMGYGLEVTFEETRFGKAYFENLSKIAQSLPEVLIPVVRGAAFANFYAISKQGRDVTHELPTEIIGPEGEAARGYVDLVQILDQARERIQRILLGEGRSSEKDALLIAMTDYLYREEFRVSALNTAKIFETPESRITIYRMARSLAGEEPYVNFYASLADWLHDHAVRDPLASPAQEVFDVTVDTSQLQGVNWKSLNKLANHIGSLQLQPQAIAVDLEGTTYAEYGFIPPESTVVEFAVDEPHLFIIRMNWRVSDKEEPTSLSLRFDTNTKTFDWNIPDDPFAQNLSQRLRTLRRLSMAIVHPILRSVADCLEAPPRSVTPKKEKVKERPDVDPELAAARRRIQEERVKARRPRPQTSTKIGKGSGPNPKR